MWRSEALLLWHDPMLVAVPMRNMAGKRMIRPAVFKTKSDAGPEGIGAVVYDRHDVMLAYTSYKLPWAKDLKNKLQNQREYVGLVVASYDPACCTECANKEAGTCRSCCDTGQLQ